MNDDQQREAKRWFIDRFVHSAFGHQFALRLAGLEPIEVPNFTFNRQKNRFPTLNFSFVPEERGLLIIADRPESAWAEGLIFLDKNNNYQYITGKVIQSREVIIPEQSSNS